jgi:hypothetical protein
MSAFLNAVKAQDIPDEDIRRITRDLDSLVNTWYVKMALMFIG